MEHKRRGCIAFMFLALYGVAVVCEASYRPANIGFTELLTVRRMWEAVQLVRWSDVVNIGMMPWGIAAVTGMVGWVAWSLFRFAHYDRASRIVVPLYTVLLAVAGGWIGLFAVPYVLFQRPDGEFLSDNFARIFVVGLWTAAAIIQSVRILRAERVPAVT